MAASSCLLSDKWSPHSSSRWTTSLGKVRRARSTARAYEWPFRKNSSAWLIKVWDTFGYQIVAFLLFTKLSKRCLRNLNGCLYFSIHFYIVQLFKFGQLFLNGSYRVWSFQTLPILVLKQMCQIVHLVPGLELRTSLSWVSSHNQFYLCDKA